MLKSKQGEQMANFKWAIKLTAKLVLPTIVAAGALLFFSPKPVTEKPETKVESISVENFSNGNSQNITAFENKDQEKAIRVENGKSEANYTSPETQTKFAFTGILPEWTEKNIGEEQLSLKIRFLNKNAWTEWFSLREWEADESKDGSDLTKNYSDPIFLASATAFQYQVNLKTLDPNKTPEISGLKFTYINTSKGPNPNAEKVGNVKKANAAAPFRIISRGEWGADPALMTWGPEYNPNVKKVIIHHTAGPDGGADPAATVRGIYYFHSVSRGWGDIGYNFLIDHFGNIYEGRFGGDGVIGGHARGYNSGSVGISMIGTYSDIDITGAAREALTTLAAYKTAQYNIDPAGASNVSGYNPDSGAPETRFTYNIAGHRDYAQTACPGGTLYSTFATVRSIAAAKAPQFLNFNLVKTADNATAYLVDSNKKYIIPSEAAFYSWGFKWGQIKIVDQTTLDGFQAAGLLGNLAKTAGDATVYLIDSGKKLPITGEVFSTYGFGFPDVLVLSNEVVGIIPQATLLNKVIKSPSNPTTYFIEAGKKRPIPNPETFFNLGFNWNNITIISDFNLNKIPTGTVVLRNGALMKSPTNPATYLFDQGNKYIIPNAETFFAYGFSWNSVISISDEEIASYPTANNLSTLVKGSAEVTYLVDSGKKLPIPNPETFFSYGFNWLDVIVLSDEVVVRIPQGVGVTTVTKGSSPTAYFIEAGKKRPIPNPETFFNLGFNWNNITIISDFNLNKIPTGTVVLRNGALMKSPTNPATYLFDQGNKYIIPNAETFFAYGFSWNSVISISDEEIASYPTANNLSTLVKGSAEVTYLVDSGKKLPIPNPETFFSYGFNWLDVIVLSDEVVARIPQGVGVTVYVKSPAPTVYIIKNGKKNPIPNLDAFNILVGDWTKVVLVSDWFLNKIPLEGTAFGPQALVSGTGSFNVYAGPRFLGTWGTNQVVSVSYAASTATYSITAPGLYWQDQAYVRVVPLSGVLYVPSYSDIPSWNTSLNDNSFRGVIEVRYSSTSNAVWVINELLLEDYLKGIGETSSSSPAEHLKTMTVAARSYANYHISRGGKHPGEPFHLKNSRNGNGDDQQYKGYGLESRFPQLSSAVSATSNQVVTYGGAPVVTPYFSRTDGRTRSAQEVWGWTNTPWLVSVADPDCNGMTLLGHGVGLSGTGSVSRASRGEGYQSILSYYYQGTALGNIGNPIVRVAIYKVQ